MSTLKPNFPQRSWRQRLLARVTPMLGACIATLLAMPVNAAITLPTEPLTTGARIPPNVLFILDDSGSMSSTFMPDAVPATTSPNISTQTYTRNTIFYNPSRTYAPWVDSTGTVRTDGDSYNEVYSDVALASGATINLSNNVQTFYVPKDTSRTDEAYLAAGANYYRYQILSNGSIYQSTYETYTSANTPNNAGLMGCSTDNSTRNFAWRGCTNVTPLNGLRSETAERTNYAIWYSYYRTRTKTAKAGAGRAFSALGSNIRVGFRTINQRNGSAGNVISEAIPIPVTRNDGLFDDPSGINGLNNNRTQWFDRLYTVPGTNSATPLRGALTRAGTYYSSDAANGAYGPQSGNDQYSCRQNFTILTTDGYWNETTYANQSGEQDNVSGSAITNSRGDSYTYAPTNPYASSDSYGGQGNLADVAMRFWKSDLRTNLENNVPTTSADPAFWQHMVTFGISIGEKGTLDPATDLPALSAGTKSWPVTSNNDIANIDDLWHATVNGRGDFVVATDPDAFVQGITAALAAITERTGSFSNVSANSTSLDAGTRVFQATYKSGLWTGDVAAYGVSSSDGVSDTASWRASERIPIAGRKIFTSNGTAGAAFPTAAQQAALQRTGTTNYPVSGADNASYLAGTRQLELQNGGSLRNRVHVLGDIVSSSPAYVSDTNTLYVGANDGMLHAFNAASGAELFGFFPSGINWSDLGTLSRPDYTHRFFVDGPVVVSNRTQTPSKNILVGALGKGGKGLFALDVTNPASFAAANFKWDAGASDADMGLVQGRPFIAKLNNGITALVVSNGLNSTNGRAVLFVYNLDTGALIKKIDTGVGSAVTDSVDSNGLSEPVGWDADGNGTADYVYAGDILGNVWKFDLSATTATTWGISGNAPIFSATYTGSSPAVRQPITSGITVAMHPTTFRTWIFFGTGRLITTGDMTNTTVQSVYGFMEDGTTKSRSGSGANLTPRSLVLAQGGLRSFQANAALPASSKGWYLDLLTPPSATAEGERLVSGTQLLSNVLVFSSVIPTASACTPDGIGYLNALDAFTGTGTRTSFFDVNGNGNFSDDTLTGGTGTKLPVGSINPGVGMTTQANLLKGLAAVGGSSGGTADVKIPEPRNVGRVSWREVKRGD
ncbi:PilC/PilY family type IV pilus protein [Xanthomonas campestris pv. campestris]|nr:PilC/PilY family type IV pilus protein [Xanthomonas campestris pv. campestris]